MGKKSNKDLVRRRSDLWPRLFYRSVLLQINHIYPPLAKVGADFQPWGFPELVLNPHCPHGGQWKAHITVGLTSSRPFTARTQAIVRLIDMWVSLCVCVHNTLSQASVYSPSISAVLHKQADEKRLPSSILGLIEDRKNTSTKLVIWHCTHF